MLLITVEIGFLVYWHPMRFRDCIGIEKGEPKQIPSALAGGRGHICMYQPMDPVISYFPIVLQKQQEHLAQRSRSLIQLGLPMLGWYVSRQEAFVAPLTRSSGHEDNLLGIWAS
jgi:hypothetical protein